MRTEIHDGSDQRSTSRTPAGAGLGRRTRAGRPWVATRTVVEGWAGRPGGGGPGGAPGGGGGGGGGGAFGPPPPGADGSEPTPAMSAAAATTERSISQLGPRRLPNPPNPASIGRSPPCRTGGL